MIHKMSGINVIKPWFNTDVFSRDNYVENWVPVRPGSQDHDALPSRMGDKLHYRDGRVEDVK